MKDNDAARDDAPLDDSSFDEIVETPPEAAAEPELELEVLEDPQSDGDALTDDPEAMTESEEEDLKVTELEVEALEDPQSDGDAPTDDPKATELELDSAGGAATQEVSTEKAPEAAPEDALVAEDSSDNEFSDADLSDEAFYEDEPAAGDEDKPRRGSVGSRYVRTAKAPPTRRKKRLMAMLILSLPVILIGVVAAMFLVKVDSRHPDKGVTPDRVTMWKEFLRIMDKGIKPTGPKKRVVIEEPAPQPAETPKKHEKIIAYEEALGRAIRFHSADLLRFQQKQEMEQSGAETLSPALKEKYYQLATGLIDRLKATETQLATMMDTIVEEKIEGITRAHHRRKIITLVSLRTNLWTFQQENKATALVDGHSTATPKNGKQPPEVIKDPPKPEPEDPPIVKDPPKPEPEDPPIVKDPPKPEPEDPPIVKDPPKPEPEDPPIVKDPPKPEPEDPPVVKPPPKPAPVRRTASVMIKEGDRLLERASHSILHLTKMKMPDDPTTLLQMLLESEDTLAGLDDAETKYARATKEMKADRVNGEEIGTVRSTLSRLRKMRTEFTGGFLKRLERKIARWNP